MDIVGDRRFVEIPGDRLHELPPLMVRTSPDVRRLDKVMDMANDIVESEELIAEATLPSNLHADWNDNHESERRRMDLAVNLVDQYLAFVTHWQWGDSILGWIKHCETQFQFTHELRNVLSPDLWPHAGRCSFVTLLADKAVKHEPIDLERAVGMRLTFRQPPPIRCFSNQFLLYLNSTVASTAYSTWSHMAPDPVASLPPERFTFQVLTM